MFTPLITRYIIPAALLASALSGCVRPSMPQHFNDSAIKEDARSPDIIPHLKLKAGHAVADLGAGGGYYSIKLGRTVGPDGKVFAVDLDTVSIDFIRKYAKNEGTINVETVVGRLEDPGLDVNSVDLVFLRNAYHDFGDRIAYFTRLRKVLKKGGRIAVIDYDPAKLGFMRKLFGHSIDEGIIIDEMGRAGYRHVANHAFLPEQSFNIFTPK